MVCVFSEVIGGRLFKMVSGVCTELPALKDCLPCCLLQKNLQGRDRKEKEKS